MKVLLFLDRWKKGTYNGKRYQSRSGYIPYQKQELLKYYLFLILSA